MKKLLLFTLFSVFLSLASAQTVENIRVEQDGEKLKIHYRIGGSTSEQFYFVTLTCSIEGGPVFEPKSVDGDVGANIRGGKSFNTVVWDVFKDVEEVGSVEFFVKVDLTKDEHVNQQARDESEAVKNVVPEVSPNTTQGKQKFERTIFIQYSASAGGYYDNYSLYWTEKIRPVGIKAGYMGNWGGYGALRFGWDYDDLYGDYFGYSAVGGVTKHIIGKKSYRLYGYAGLGIDGYDLLIEGGLTLTGVAAEWFVIDVGIASTPGYVSALVLGAGFIF